MNENHVMTKSVPSSQEVQFLEDQLYEFNSAQTGQDDGQLFAFFIRNGQQEIVAGLSGWTWAHACEIRILWVHPAWRGQGYGRSLLESAEQEADNLTKKFFEKLAKGLYTPHVIEPSAGADRLALARTGLHKIGDGLRGHGVAAGFSRPNNTTGEAVKR